jgi:putative acetyltransferase
MSPPHETIRREPPRQPEVAALIDQADALLAGLYPPESNPLVDVAGLEAPAVAFFVARRDGRAVGCGAWRRTAAAEAELKRLFVAPAARGTGLGRRLLAALEADAAAAGVRVLRLETGISQPEALGLYRSAGYAERGPFAPYGPDPFSLFFEKRLGPVSMG